MLKAGFVQANMQPGLGQLSEATSFYNQNIIVHGNPDRGQHDARPDDRLYLLKGGVHTAREEDDAQCDHTDELRHFDRTERNEIQPEQHADPQKEQQRGGAEAVSDLAGHHRHEEQQGSDQHYIFTTDVYHSVSLIFNFLHLAPVGE